MTTQPLNEAFASSFMQKNWSNKNLQYFFLRVMNKKIDPNRLTNDYFKTETPDKALKLHEDVIKFWIKSGKIVMTTRSNSFFDRNFIVDKRKRGYIECNDTAAEEQCLKEGNSFLKTMDSCVIFDWQKAQKELNTKAIADERSAARKGATALMTNRQIKAANITRYQAMIKEMGFSDGSEFALINNINKLFIDSMNKAGSTKFVFTNLKSSWVINYLQAYSNTLVEYMGVLDANGFFVKDNDRAEEDRKRSLYNRDKSINGLREKLKNAIDTFKEYLNLQGEDWKPMIKMIVNNDAKWQEFKTKVSAWVETNHNKAAEKSFSIIEQTIATTEHFKNVVMNPNLSSDIMNFDLFVSQLSIIQNINDHSNYEEANQITDVLNYFYSWNKTNDDKYIEPMYLSKIDGTINRKIKSITQLINKI